jgi:hypothetical protein
MALWLEVGRLVGDQPAMRKLGETERVIMGLWKTDGHS